MSVCGEEQTPNNEREQARSQKSAMGAVLGGLGVEPPAAGGQWGSGGEAPSRWGSRGKAPSHQRHGGYEAEALALENFAFFWKNNFILGLF